MFFRFLSYRSNCPRHQSFWKKWRKRLHFSAKVQTSEEKREKSKQKTKRSRVAVPILPQIDNDIIRTSEAELMLLCFLSYSLPHRELGDGLGFSFEKEERDEDEMKGQWDLVNDIIWRNWGMQRSMNESYSKVNNYIYRHVLLGTFHKAIKSKGP